MTKSGWRIRTVRWTALFGTLLSSSACFSPGQTTCNQESEPLEPLRGTVRDARTGEPLAGSIVMVELCKLYSENPDPSKAHPNYRYSAMTGGDGTFSVQVPRGPVGLHTFQVGYRYGFVDIKADAPRTDIQVRAEPLLPADKIPSLKNFVVSPASVVPGAKVRFSLEVTAGTAKDPLSDEVVLAEPSRSFGRAMTPPSRGLRGKAFPDGLWTLDVEAPTIPGKYTYMASATSEGCVTGARPLVELVVR